MANATANIKLDSMGSGPFSFDVPVKGSTHIYAGTLISQHSGGYYVPTTTSGGGAAVGVASHEMNNAGADGAARVRIETMRAFAFKNGATTNAFSDTSKLGAPVYALDDNTVADNSNAGANPCVGYFLGFESDGKVRVFVDPGYSYKVGAMNALLALTNSPANADALRDEIVSIIGTNLL